MFEPEMSCSKTGLYIWMQGVSEGLGRYARTAESYVLALSYLLCPVHDLSRVGLRVDILVIQYKCCEQRRLVYNHRPAPAEPSDERDVVSNAAIKID